MEPSVNKNMLFDHFAGKSTPLQKRLIEAWLHTEQNRELFYQWLIEWEHQSPPYLPELDAPLRRYIAHMETDQTPTDDQPAALPHDTALPVVSSSVWFRWAAAAAILLCLGIGAWLTRDSLLFNEYRTGFGETKAFLLSDGSRVTLNANSTLQVPRFGFGKQTREVLLTGEAEFSVRHKPDNSRFIVKTKRGFDVTVLGTVFTVYARQRGGKVVLSQGKVQLRYQQGKTTGQLLMRPGELVTLDRQNDLKKQVTRQVHTYTAWKEHRFLFDDTSLREFAEILADNYGITVIIPDDTLAQRTLVGSFRAESADELLKTVSEIFDLTMVRSGNEVRLIQKK